MSENLINYVTIGSATVAAVASLWNIYIQYRNHKEQMRAQIIAQSRVNWMKEVRNVYHNFIKICTEYHNQLLFIESNKDAKDLNSLRGEVWASYYLLISYFPNEDSDGRNNRLMHTFEDLIIYLEDKLEYSFQDPTYSDFKPTKEELLNINISEQYQYILENIAEEFSGYIKIEWMKTKKETVGSKK